jgi:Leucine-rich repeat (LRR) protein
MTDLKLKKLIELIRRGQELPLSKYARVDIPKEMDVEEYSQLVHEIGDLLKLPRDKLDAAVKNTVSKTALDLSNNNAKHTPIWLTVKTLRPTLLKLNLSGNNLKSLAELTVCFPLLQVLDISHNQLTDL